MNSKYLAFKNCNNEITGTEILGLHKKLLVPLDTKFRKPKKKKKNIRNVTISSKEKECIFLCQSFSSRKFNRFCGSKWKIRCGKNMTFSFYYRRLYKNYRTLKRHLKSICKEISFTEYDFTIWFYTKHHRIFRRCQ